MGDAYFYHLTRQTTGQALLPLLHKCLQNQWRVVVRGVEPQQLSNLDEQLWLGEKDSFLPHGVSGGDHDADQPILLSVQGETHSCDCLICVDGADVTVAEVEIAQRVCILFQDDSADQMAQARSQWLSLTDQGAPAQYWSQANGKWELKAQKP